ncbi:hypothetical protein NQ317_015373 [Molorchus minor]|uniref:Major facilitator superfamily (MFS) profile domain-containing protein n=1 Tax=Molorchus minor TaxID=1323400 RepID=A0ABQ9J494_9CUCU|nr:hypothetical protein NQ317_015373 [Molorchus minor]
MFFTERIGRKKSLLLASLVVLIAWIAIALGDNIIYLFIARFGCGMAGNMAFVAAPMYLAEIADQKIRGFLSSIIFLMMLFGCLVVYCVGPFLPYYVPSVIGAAIAITELSIFSFMPESPYYLLYKNKPEEAKKSLAYFRSNRGVEKEIKEISDAIERQKTEKGRLQDLFAIKSNRKAIIIMTALNGGQNFCAIVIVMMNLHIILAEAGSIYMEDAYAGIVFAVIMLLSASIAAFQLDKYGRKMLLVTSAVLTGFCLFIIAIYFHLKYVGYDMLPISWIPIVAVMIYAASYKMGVGIVPIVITAEVFPAKMKSIGMTISDAMFVVWGIVSLQMYQWLVYYGLHVPFYLFAGCSIFLGVFTWLYIPETKGKTLEEIQFILKGEKYCEHPVTT